MSAMSVPVGPHGSLEVAGGHCQRLCCQRGRAVPFGAGVHTIADLDLDGGIALGDILDAAEDLRHGGESLLLRRAII